MNNPKIIAYNEEGGRTHDVDYVEFCCGGKHFLVTKKVAANEETGFEYFMEPELTESPCHGKCQAVTEFDDFYRQEWEFVQSTKKGKLKNEQLKVQLEPIRIFF